MKKYEIISFIRDQLLANPKTNAEFIWTFTRLSDQDDDAYYLLCKWMEETNPFKRAMVEISMSKYLNNTEAKCSLYAF